MQYYLGKKKDTDYGIWWKVVSLSGSKSQNNTLETHKKEYSLAHSKI